VTAPRWLFLDVDDTLVATFETALAKFAVVARRHGIAEPTAEALLAAGYGTRPFIECVPKLFPGLSPALLAADYDALADTVPTLALSGAGQLAAVARGLGMRVGILTNGPRHKTTRKLAALGLTHDDFDIVRCAEDVTVLKPAPAAFTDLCAQAGADVEYSWYVSDSPADWAGAEAAGLGAIGLVGRPSAGGPGLPRLAVADCAALAGALPALPERRPGTWLSPVAVLSLDLGSTLFTPVQDVTVLIARAGALPQPTAAARLALEVFALPPGTWSNDQANRTALLAAYTAVLAPDPAAEDLAVRIYEDFRAAGNWRPIGRRLDLLKELAGDRLRRTVVSNWQSDLGEFLAAHGVVWLDAVLASCAEGMEKPGTALFQTALDRLGSSASELLHVGDLPQADLAGPLRLGGRAALLRPEDCDHYVAALLTRARDTSDTRCSA
jgi:FMN phosphatase YigB (HAD superfamily)